MRIESGSYGVSVPRITDSRHTRIEPVAPEQKVSLPEGVVLDLGSLGGKEFTMTIHDNVMEWSGGRLVPGSTTPGSRVTPEQQRACNASKAYSLAEHREASQILPVVYDLHLMAKNGWSVDYFNQHMEQLNLTSDRVQRALGRVGIDTAKPFEVNGRSYIFADGRLQSA